MYIHRKRKIKSTPCTERVAFPSLPCLLRSVPVHKYPPCPSKKTASVRKLLAPPGRLVVVIAESLYPLHKDASTCTRRSHHNYNHTNTPIAPLSCSFTHTPPIFSLPCSLPHPATGHTHSYRASTTGFTARCLPLFLPFALRLGAGRRREGSATGTGRGTAISNALGVDVDVDVAPDVRVRVDVEPEPEAEGADARDRRRERMLLLSLDVAASASSSSKRSS
ncbi:hypothetical protein K438DRAFT_1856381 [Mycena galopus ATCC 62051]|nr:hypothetical protein K438DRAFT_1856381 [Mycena galopus ATCC 62051]